MKRPQSSGRVFSITDGSTSTGGNNSEMIRMRTDMNNMRREMENINKQFETQQAWMQQATITIDKMFSWIVPKSSRQEACDLSAAMGALNMVEQQRIAAERIAEIDRHMGGMSLQQQQLM